MHRQARSRRMCIVFSAMTVWSVVMWATHAVAGANSWTGTWKTDRGTMRLVQQGDLTSGANVTGTVSIVSTTTQGMVGGLSFDEVAIVAIAMDDQLTGSWKRAPTYAPPNDAGDVHFILSSDGNSFNGNWRYGYQSGAAQTKTWEGAWNGTRISAAPSPPPAQTKQTACASAKPSITSGSEFKRATFTIGGAQPQTVKVIGAAENFAITTASGRLVYQVIDGTSWGSLTLDPGSYVLSCNGGGAMGLMSASVCVEYMDAPASPPPGDPIPVSPPGSSTRPSPPKPKPKPKPELPPGPIERIMVKPTHGQPTLTGQIGMRIGEKESFTAWGADAAHPDRWRRVTVDQWSVDKRGVDRGSIDSDTGDFEAGPKTGEVKVIARVGALMGTCHVKVSEKPPILFSGCVRLYDENNRLLRIPAQGVPVEVQGAWFKSRAAHDKYMATTTQGLSFHILGTIWTDQRGRYEFTLPAGGYQLLACFVYGSTITCPTGYEWGARLGGAMSSSSDEARWSGPMNLAGGSVGLSPDAWPCLQLWLEPIVVTYRIKGTVMHHGQPVQGAVVTLLDGGRKVDDDRSDYSGEYSLNVGSLPAGRYTLTAKWKPSASSGPVTVHDWLYVKQDVPVMLPLQSETKVEDIEMISFAEKIGYRLP